MIYYWAISTTSGNKSHLLEFSLLFPFHVAAGQNSFVLFLFVDFLHVVTGSQHLFVLLLGGGALLRRSLSSLASFFVHAAVQLNLGVFENAPEILSDPIFSSEILLSKVDRFFVGENGSRIRAEELLLDAHIVVCNCKHGGSIL